jgi:hypothetical protein
MPVGLHALVHFNTCHPVCKDINNVQKNVKNYLCFGSLLTAQSPER